MTYSTQDFNKDVNKLRELIRKCEELEEKKETKYLYKPFRNSTNYNT